MRWTDGAFLLMLLPGLAGAVGFFPDDTPREWVNPPKPGRFSVCFNHSCAETAIIGVSEADWQRIRDQFSPPPKDPAEERKRIAKAIGLMEIIVGPLINTQNDKSMNFKGALAEGNQQDCIDESTDTTTYLTLMEQDGLFRFHRVQETSTRGWFIMGLPHTTAVVRDKQSKIDYAVDSWFHDNGVEPEVLPVDEWWRGWHPPEFKQYRPQ